MPIYSMMSNSETTIAEEVDVFGSTIQPGAIMFITAGYSPASKLMKLQDEPQDGF
jgi:hypothetical protein